MAQNHLVIAIPIAIGSSPGCVERGFNQSLHFALCETRLFSFVGQGYIRFGNVLFFSLLTLLLVSARSSAQSTYTNQVFMPEIKSIEFYNTAKQASFPAINLRANEQVQLDFDDLHGGSRNFYYTIEHCDENWNSSNLSTAEYLVGFTEDRITNYNYSTATLQKYTHYEVKFPNDNIKPKITGNYILKVYEDDDPTKIVLTRKLYVYNSRLLVNANVVAASDAAQRLTDQKINFQLDYTGLNVQNPTNDLHTFIMQNARSETGQTSAEPASIRGSTLIYDDINTNIFPGRNEFMHVDLRTLKLNSDRVSKISRDTAYAVVLLTDGTRNQPAYVAQYDLDGNFFPGNQDGTDPRTDGDYAHVYFSLAASQQPADGDVYIVGQFNNYQLDANSRLHYEALSHRYYISILLKQGVTDYEYIWVDKSGKADDVVLEGSHFETENDYQVLVYYRPAGARWTELVGYKLLNTAGK